MKHDILFRGKRVDNGEWKTGDLLRSKDYLSDIKHSFIFTDAVAYPANEFCGYEEVDPSTVGRYTGLTDKNGVKIFEGDVVSAQDETGTELYRFVVKFGQCGGIKSKQYEEVGFMGFYFEGTISTCVREFFLRADPIYWLNAYKCVIIGNIYDNMTLLEGGEGNHDG